MTEYNFIYDAPCGDKVTGTIRLAGDQVEARRVVLGRVAMDMNETWTPMENLGAFESEEDMVRILNERKGWSVVAKDLTNG